jgi:hypothetical protein
MQAAILDDLVNPYSIKLQTSRAFKVFSLKDFLETPRTFNSYTTRCSRQVNLHTQTKQMEHMLQILAHINSSSEKKSLTTCW